MKSARFNVEQADPGRLIIRDIGPWEKFPTVTNDAENVVKRLFSAKILRPGDRLFYYDSDGRLDEIKFSAEGKFLGFAPGGQETEDMRPFFRQPGGLP